MHVDAAAGDDRLREDLFDFVVADLIPESLGTFGFDVTFPGSSNFNNFNYHSEKDREKEEEVHDHGNDKRMNSSEDGRSSGDGPDDARKKQRTTGAWINQREVQKRYRERKKNHTKELETKVVELEKRLKWFEAQKKDFDAATSAAAERSRGGIADSEGAASCTQTEPKEKQTMLPGGLHLQQLVSTGGNQLCAEDGGGSGGGNNEEMESHGHGCNVLSDPKKVTDFRNKFNHLVDRLREHLNADSPEGELRDSLMGMAKASREQIEIAIQSQKGASMVLAKNAKLINDERELRCGVGGSGSCSSISGGPLRVIGLDGEVYNDADTKLHWRKVCDAFEQLVSPMEITKLLQWRADYVATILDIYNQRRQLGMQLAFAGCNTESGGRVDGGTRNVSVGGAGLVAALPTDTTEIPTNENPTKDNPTKDVAIAGESKQDTYPFSVQARCADAAATDSGIVIAEQAATSNALSIIAELNHNVRRELHLKLEGPYELIFNRVQLRTSAHMIILSHPLVPDMLEVCGELARRRLAQESNAAKNIHEG